jgi:phosphatidylglycerol:prolipoprotein diacylglycerol transferase
MPLAFWLHHLNPFLGPHIGNIGIRYYGLSYILGFLTATWLLRSYSLREISALKADRVGDLMVTLVFGVLLGGRLGYFLFYRFDLLKEDPLALVRVWEGGMASHGGMIGVAVAIVWFSKSEKIPLTHLGDLIVSVAPAGLFFGRIANFINGELWGRISVVPWAVVFPQSAAPGTPLSIIPPRHPSQLYEAGLEGLVLFIYIQVRFWMSDVRLTKPGHLVGEFFIGYAFVRAIGETFREPDAGLILGLSRGTFYSLFLIIAGLGFVISSRLKKVK